MLTFGIDWDDVISPLNECAIELANQECELPHTVKVCGFY